MPRSHVFLVHGMGRHPDGWAEPWIENIIENLRQFSPYADKSPEDIRAEDVHFVPVGYDDVFEKEYREKWSGLADALADTALPSPLRTVMSALDSNDADGVEQVFWEHLLDPLLWYTLGQARQRVIAKVATQLAAGIQEAQAEEGSIHLVAHSLGTSVAHDTVLAMTDSALTGGAFDSLQGGLRWDSILMVANVSRLLSAPKSPSSQLPVEAFRPHQSRVRPGTGGLTRHFINVQHRLDPFTFPREFNPMHWNYGGYTGLPPLRRFDEITGVHAFETHFDCPAVSQRFLRLVTGRGALGSSSEMNDAWNRYDQQYGRTAGGELAALRDQTAPDADRKLGVGELARYLFDAAKEVLA